MSHMAHICDLIGCFTKFAVRERSPHCVKFKLSCESIGRKYYVI